MQLNPILALELRARWRMNRSFLLLLGVAAALSLLAAFVYENAFYHTANAAFDPLSGTMTAAPSDSQARAGAIGRELFVTLAHTNIIVWLLIAAASAATGIARERERGLLESLQLSRISAASQIGARFGANLLLLGALQLVLLPIYSVAFLMGGISPLEVGQNFYLVAWSAILGTMLGLWFSARSHRPTNALFGALGTIALFSIGAGYLCSWGYFFIWGVGATAIFPIYLLHPSALFAALTAPNFFALLRWQPLTTVIAVSAFWLVLCGALWWSALRNINRTLAPAAWQSNAVWVEWLRARQVAAPAQSKAKQRASGALLADLPLDRFVRFSDPLLAREVKSRFRLRRVGFWLGLVRFALFLVAASVWLLQVFSFFDAQSRLQMVPGMLMVFLLGGTLCLAVLSATSWTRERESGTWESLKLSLLPPRQILRAKWLSPLISFAYYSAPLWILLPLGLLYVSFDSFVGGVAVVAAWLGLAVALGLWMSWRVKNGTGAIAWTVGVLALLMVGLPALNSVLNLNSSLAQWRYGVRGYEDQQLFSSYYGGGPVMPVGEDLAARYRAETGRSVPAPMPRPAAPAVGQAYVYPQPSPEQMELQMWGNQQIERAERFKRQIGSWNPIETVGDLFENRPNYNNYGLRDDEFNQDSLTVRHLKLALWNMLAPSALTLMLLLLLRRDVRREQLNA